MCIYIYNPSQVNEKSPCFLMLNSQNLRRPTGEQRPASAKSLDSKVPRRSWRHSLPRRRRGAAGSQGRYNLMMILEEDVSHIDIYFFCIYIYIYLFINNYPEVYIYIYMQKVVYIYIMIVGSSSITFEDQ